MADVINKTEDSKFMVAENFDMLTEEEKKIFIRFVHLSIRRATVKGLGDEFNSSKPVTNSIFGSFGIEYLTHMNEMPKDRVNREMDAICSTNFINARLEEIDKQIAEISADADKALNKLLSVGMIDKIMKLYDKQQEEENNGKSED